jgi:hypothetical protein
MLGSGEALGDGGSCIDTLCGPSDGGEVDREDDVSAGDGTESGGVPMVEGERGVKSDELPSPFIGLVFPGESISGRGASNECHEESEGESTEWGTGDQPNDGTLLISHRIY